METVLLAPEAGRPLPATILLDDTTLFEDNLQQNLDDAVEAILRVTKAGAMVGPKKCVLGTREAEYMGEKWTSGGYFRPPRDKLAALLELSSEQLADWPRAKLYGLLSYWRSYVPDFAARTAKLRELLSQDASPWGPEHADAVRKVVAAILTEVPTLNFDPTSPAILETHVGPKGLAAVYLQKDPGARRYLPVASYSQEITTAEMQKPVVALELMAAQEAARKLS